MQIIRISAIWCPACIITDPIVKELDTKYPDILFHYLDFDDDDEIIKKYEVGNKLPVLIMLDDNNKELGRLIGEKSKEQINTFIDEYYKKENKDEK